MAQSSEARPFRLGSRSGGPDHVFELESGEQNTKSAVYIRKDGQKIKWDDEFGWSARDEKGGLLTAPWGQPAAKQGNTLPEGIWIGRKGDHAYVYAGAYGVSQADKKAQAQKYREAIGGVEM